MKTIYIFLIALFISITLNAQIVDIPDANFKNALVNTLCVDTNGDFTYDDDADTNNDGEIQVSEAELVLRLNVSNQSIASLEGIEHFINLQTLYCSSNQINNLDVTSLTNLIGLGCSSNPLISLNTNNLPNLESLSCNFTSLNTLVIDNLPNLEILACYQGVLETLTLGNSPNLIVLDCSDNQITALDLTGTPNLDELYCFNNQITFLDLSNKAVNTYFYECANNQIETLLIKNGNDIEDMIYWDLSEFNFYNNPLTYVCGDENELGLINSWLSYHEISNCAVSSYCSFVPGGEYYSVEGNTKFDLDSNGCDTNDLIYTNLNFTVTNGTETGNFISDTTGNYSIPVQDGNHTITPVLENPSYFTVSPTEITVSFPTDTSPFLQDFCVTPNGTYHDLEITVLPIGMARPGFDADYKLIYKNKGTTTLSGSIDLTFMDELMDFVSASPIHDVQSENLLSWNFSDLNPFESREILFTMNINAPTDIPAVNDGDVLVFSSTINSSETDETPDDNVATLNQTVVNSFDPNDKTCLEGEFITPEMVGKYVHYMIRFENTGSAEAINIVVKDDIDTTKYDISTLTPIDASHEYVARIQNDSPDHYVEFIFENINLPFDDANNDGYIAFKIKTLNSLQLGDTFENDAEIYFDFNFPIITNSAETTVQTLSIAEQSFNNDLLVYPNPSTDGVVTIETTYPFDSITLYDITGRIVQEIKFIGNKTNFELPTHNLAQGNYFLEVQSDTRSAVKKMVVL